MARTRDNEEYPTARLRRFEQWRQQQRHTDESLLQCYTISSDADQNQLRRCLHNAALNSREPTGDIIAHARLPYSDSVYPDHCWKYRHLYLIRNIFDLEQDNVVWIFDGDAGLGGRHIQSAVGCVDEVLERVEMLGLVRRVEDVEEKDWVMWRVWKRLELWMEVQKLRGAV